MRERTAQQVLMVENLSVKRYPILRLISSAYKILSFLALTAGVVLGIGIPFANAAPQQFVELVIRTGLAFMVSGGLAALGFYTIARLIDLFLETNNNTRMIAEALKEQAYLLRQIHKRQANLYPRPEAAIAERKARLIPDEPASQA